MVLNEPFNLSAALGGLPSKAKPPNSARVLDVWITQAEDKLGLTPRPWPARLTAYPHWSTSYTKAAKSAGLTLTLNDAVTQVNTWLNKIDTAPR